MATRVATAGALKMNQEGYTFEPYVPVALGGNVRRADKYGYAVIVPTKDSRGDCTCAFFKANWDFGVCKHSVWAGWQVAALTGESARNAEEDRIADEAAERMAGAECPTRGTAPDKWRAIA
ncbi:hypothetical protein [Armatimonas sp.]|uniref:hypothetical protein n=1 Tax=Armatimonas sp. TaxID=1872638 RepID=UPI00375332DC